MGMCSWLIGTTGVGKTTMLREVTRLLNDAYKTVVVVVDTTSLHGGSHLWDALIGSRNPLHFTVPCSHGADTGIPEGLRSDSISHSIYLHTCLLYTSPSPRDRQKSRMPSSA